MLGGGNLPAISFRHNFPNYVLYNYILLSVITTFLLCAMSYSKHIKA